MTGEPVALEADPRLAWPSITALRKEHGMAGSTVQRWKHKGLLPFYAVSDALHLADPVVFAKLAKDAKERAAVKKLKEVDGGE